MSGFTAGYQEQAQFYSLANFYIQKVQKKMLQKSKILNRHKKMNGSKNA